MGISNNNGLKLNKVTPVRVFEQAVEQLRALILSGDLAEGQKLPPEKELRSQFNISRSSIREALRVLEAEGLVEVKKGRGAFVTRARAPLNIPEEMARWLKQREETLEQILQVRESIEGLVARLAAAQASAREVEGLRNLVEQQRREVEAMKHTGDQRVEQLARLDAEFHLTIASFSGNDIANEIVNHIIPAADESNKAFLYLSKRAERMEQEHRLILEAIADQKPDEAEKAMRKHLVRVREEILEINRKGNSMVTR